MDCVFPFLSLNERQKTSKMQNCRNEKWLQWNHAAHGQRGRVSSLFQMPLAGHCDPCVEMISLQVCYSCAKKKEKKSGQSHRRRANSSPLWQQSQIMRTSSQTVAMSCLLMKQARFLNSDHMLRVQPCLSVCPACVLTPSPLWAPCSVLWLLAWSHRTEWTQRIRS